MDEAAIGLAAAFRDRIALLQRGIELMESRRAFTGEMSPEGQQVDTTPSSIERSRSDIEQLEEAIQILEGGA